MDIKKIITNIVFIFVFLILSTSSFLFVFLGYSIINEDNFLNSLKTAFIADILANKQYSIEVNKEMLNALCELDIKIEFIPNFKKYKPLFCIKVREGEIDDEKDVKVFLGNVYFEEQIKTTLVDYYFKNIKQVEYVVGTIMIISFVLVVLFSRYERKKSIIWGAIINLAFLILILIFIKESISSSIENGVPKEYLESFPATINFVKVSLEESITYSLIISFIVSESATFIGKIIEIYFKKGENKVEN